MHARLSGQGDWDLGVFDARTRRSVAGSAALRANELAEGFVRRGQRLIVQSCRVRGSSSSANLRIAAIALSQARAASDGPTQIVSVRTDRRGVRVFQESGLDVTEHMGEGGVDVVLHGAGRRGDAARDRHGLRRHVEDVEAQDDADRRADGEWAAGRDDSALPSGATEYRRLPTTRPS